jgi:hypothetical protein
MPLTSQIWTDACDEGCTEYSQMQHQTIQYSSTLTSVSDSPLPLLIINFVSSIRHFNSGNAKIYLIAQIEVSCNRKVEFTISGGGGLL